MKHRFGSFWPAMRSRRCSRDRGKPALRSPRPPATRRPTTRRRSTSAARSSRTTRIRRIRHHRQRREQLPSERLQRHAGLHQRHGEHLALALVPHHAGRRARGAGSVPSGGNVNVPGLTGTLTYRLKYAYGQINFDDVDSQAGWLGPARPSADARSSTSRSRSTAIGSRGRSSPTARAHLTSSDLGFSTHWALPGQLRRRPRRRLQRRGVHDGRRRTTRRPG